MTSPTSPTTSEEWLAEASWSSGIDVISDTTTSEDSE